MTNEEIEIINKVLNSLCNNGWGNISEINNRGSIPGSNAELLKFQVIQDEMVNREWVRIVAKTKNDGISGLYTLEILPAGKSLVHRGVSVASVYEKEERKDSLEAKIKELDLRNKELDFKLKSEQEKNIEKDQSIKNLTEDNLKFQRAKNWEWLVRIFIGISTAIVEFIILYIVL